MRNTIAMLLLLGIVFLVRPREVIAQATCPAVVTVQVGDTMSRVARRCAVSYAALLAANPAYTNPNLIYPGQLLNIPQGPGIPPTGTPGGQTHVVARGETLLSIARRYGTSLPALLALNPAITNADRIYAGQVIVVSPSSQGPGIPPTGGRIYVVQPGDRLFRIALRYNTTVADLQARNPWLSNPNYIQPGWQIAVP